ncbi:hypothetical protein JZ751_029477 [Albula glossodonta]|uniref:Cytochrome P450 n=1 Tax=Albula glossodonta TaxID=121402 RepID=A0A8T2P950_9TELE|nr:hypothetical protein JZ751_029477 [Albula glossodonta]
MKSFVTRHLNCDQTFSLFGQLPRVDDVTGSTTSNTLIWTLYLLSREPEVQDRLYREVSSCVSGDRLITAQDISHMPFLKAVIKETLRGDQKYFHNRNSSSLVWGECVSSLRICHDVGTAVRIDIALCGSGWGDYIG